MIKRIFDIVGASLGLLVLSPLMAIISIVVLIKMGRPIFFRQVRPGLHGKPFLMIKFRTMSNVEDKSGQALTDDKRITKTGNFLRSTSIDELPELWNVFRGNMSLVGPRPLLMAYLDRYTPAQARRHEVKPGITGWAQINGRNAITWDEKFILDVWYVDNKSLWLDISILFNTAIQVVKRKNINSEEAATMPEFLGTGD